MKTLISRLCFGVGFVFYFIDNHLLAGLDPDKHWNNAGEPSTALGKFQYWAFECYQWWMNQSILFDVHDKVWGVPLSPDEWDEFLESEYQDELNNDRFVDDDGIR